MIIGKLRIKTAPTLTAITLAEAKDHLRVTSNDDDTYITALIKVATDMVEQITRRTLMDTTYELFLDAFPPYIDLATGPVRSVVKIDYIDPDGNTQTLATANYKTDLKAEPARIYVANGKSFPTLSNEPNAVTVEFIAGYANEAAVPSAIKQAMLLIVGRYYETRQDVTDRQYKEVPKTVEHLLGPYRLLEVC